MESSDWVDLGAERLGFVANLERATGMSLFSLGKW